VAGGDVRKETTRRGGARREATRQDVAGEDVREETTERGAEETGRNTVKDGGVTGKRWFRFQRGRLWGGGRPPLCCVRED